MATPNERSSEVRDAVVLGNLIEDPVGENISAGAPCSTIRVRVRQWSGPDDAREIQEQEIVVVAIGESASLAAKELRAGDRVMANGVPFGESLMDDECDKMVTTDLVVCTPNAAMFSPTPKGLGPDIWWTGTHRQPVDEEDADTF